MAAERARRRVPFGGHQLTEYVLAAALVAVGIHLGGRPATVLIALGATMAVWAFVAKGSLGVLKVVPRKAHLYLDLVLAAGFACSPVAYLHHPEVLAIALSEAVALLLVRMSLTTEAVPRPRPSQATRGAAYGLGGRFAGRPLEAEAPAEATSESEHGEATRSAPAPVSEIAGTVATAAGRTLGMAVAKARESDAGTVAARRLGRATGSLRRLGRDVRDSRRQGSATGAGGDPSAWPRPRDDG
jgi:hypothetical protein